MNKLGLKNYVHLGFTDAGFRKVEFRFPKRKFIYPTFDKKSLFSGKISGLDSNLIIYVYEKIKGLVRSGDILYGPVGVGGHVDHVIINKLLKKFDNQSHFWLDQPYSSGNKRYNLDGYKKVIEVNLGE